MNICLVLFCLLAIVSANNLEPFQSAHQRFINPSAIMRQVLEMLRWLIKNGSQNVIPVLDPMEIEYETIHINVPNNLLTLSANFTNGLLRGLGDFEVLEAEFLKSEIAVDLSVNFPLLNLTAEHYEMEGNIYQLIPLAGYGAFEFTIVNFNLKSKIYLKQSEDGQSVIIDKFYEPEFSIDKIESHTEFDNNIDDLFNTLVEDLLAEYLTRFSKLILLKHLDSLVESLNPVLNQFETWRIIAAIL